MNILFGMYTDMTCNSASHVDGVARELMARNCECIVAVPGPTTGRHRFLPCPYRTFLFKDVLKDPRLFADGRGPDFLHMWNPREINRRFHERLSSLIPYKLVIHLEDNEEHITETTLGHRAFAQARAGKLSGDFPESLTHPLLGRKFMEGAAGFSLLIESLAEMLPPRKPYSVFWPAVDPTIFHPRPRNDILRKQLNIPEDVWVLTYHGNIHGANFKEVRSLYLSVALLNQEGIPARLVRLGKNFVPFPEGYEEWTRQFTIDLGFVVDRHRIADILAMADVYVQPGTSDPFNDYRFPSKLPEFFSLGRPVILPRTNVGLETKHLEDAYVLEHANGKSICEAVTHLHSDPQLYKRLSRGAREFDATHFSWKKSASALLDLYHGLEEKAQIPCMAALSAGGKTFAATT